MGVKWFVVAARVSNGELVQRTLHPPTFNEEARAAIEHHVLEEMYGPEIREAEAAVAARKLLMTSEYGKVGEPSGFDRRMDMSAAGARLAPAVQDRGKLTLSGGATVPPTEVIRTPKPEAPTPVAVGEAPAAGTGVPSAVEIAKMQGYTGEICEQCGSLSMVRTGKCSTCQECKNTSGCS